MKQVCSQLEARNEELEEQERMLLNNIETLEKRCMELSGCLEGPCQFCKKLEHTSHAKAHQQKEDIDDLPRSLSTPVTPFKSLPEQTEIDKLKEELFKQNKEYECLFANYQMVSEKSATHKKESKEKEKSLTELQGVCDTLKEENEALQLAYKECQRALDATRDQSRDSVIGPTKKPKKIQEESESLMREELQTSKKELKLAKNVIKRFKHKIEDNAKSHDDLESKLLQCRMRIGDLEVRNFELESLPADMKNHEKSKGVKYKEKIEELERKLRAMEEVLYKKECGLNDVIISRDLVSKENTSPLEQLDQLSQALMGANSESESLRGQLKHYDGEMQAIVSQLSDLEAVHLSCGPAKEKLENENEHLKCQVSSLKEEVAIGREELSSVKLEAKKKTLQKENEALQKKVDVLKTKVNEAKYNLKHIKKKYEKEHNYEMCCTELVKQYKSLRDEAMTVLSQPDTPTSDRQEQDGEGEGIQQYKITSTSAENLTQDNMSN